MKYLSLSLFSVAIFTFISCGSKDANAQSKGGTTVIDGVELSTKALLANVKYVDCATFNTLIKEQKDAVLIDVRTPKELYSGMIKGAVNIDIAGPDFDKKINELDKEKHYLVYCRSSKRSKAACNRMAKKGFAKLYNLQGGMLAWKKEGFASETSRVPEEEE